MDQKNSKSYMGIIIMLGAVWGLSEAALGMWLRSCASFMSGSIMTGVALFFIAAAWILSRRILGVALLVAIACLFKMFDALLLSLPILHGAVGNPIFAFLMEGLAFLVLLSIYAKKQKHKTGRRAVLGGMSALLAVNLFPLVKSCVTVPLGFWAASKIMTLETKLEETNRIKTLRLIASPGTLILCLVIITLIRLI
jgi:hypothetical protein